MLLNPRISRTGLSPMSILLYIYDGIPRQLVPDNLNTSVKKANDYYLEVERDKIWNYSSIMRRKVAF